MNQKQKYLYLQGLKKKFYMSKVKTLVIYKDDLHILNIKRKNKNSKRNVHLRLLFTWTSQRGITTMEL